MRPARARGLAACLFAACLFAACLFAACGSPADNGNERDLTVTAGRHLIAAGDSLPLGVVVTNVAGDTLPVTAADVRWSSSDAAVLTVSDDGTLHGVGEGSARATATIGSLSAGVQVEVLAPVPSFLSYVSEPGDYIGQGETARLDLAREQWQGSPTGSTGAGTAHLYLVLGEWTLDLAAPQGQVLGERTFPNATRYPFQSASEPGLNFSGAGRGCNTLTGSFTIADLVLENPSTIARLHATFTQVCEGTMPPLHGEVQLFGVSPVEWPEPAIR